MANQTIGDLAAAERPTRKGPPRKQHSVAPTKKISRRDLFKLLVPAVTFVAMTAPDDDETEAEISA